MIGQTISHYKILEKLGEGGMGIVYKAEDTKLKRTVALKFLPPQLTRDPDAKERFLHEAQAAAALEHQNICNIHEIDESGDRVFIVMSCCKGENLKEKIHRGPVKIDEALKIAVQISEGLQEAHEQGIVHRDIKSANIMIDEKSQVKIMDFGLAKLKGQTKITKEGTTLGTAAYMSPEQARGTDVDHRSDIWSLGVILNEMITGQLPFKGEYDQAVIYAIMNEEPEPLTALRTGLPMELERIVNKTLAKNPSERYQHADDLVVDLKKLKKDSEPGLIPASERAVRKPQRRMSRKYLIPGIILLIMVITAAGFLLLRDSLITNTAGKSPDLKRVVVIVFENYTGDASHDLIGRMAADWITQGLAQTGLVTVVPVMAIETTDIELKGVDRIRVLAKETRARTVVSGAFYRQGETIQFHAWVTDLYEGKLLRTIAPISGPLENPLKPIEVLRQRVMGALATLFDRKIKTLIDIRSQPPTFQAYREYIEAFELFYRRIDYKGAIEHSYKAAALDKTFTLPLLLAATAHVNLGEWAEADSICKKIDEYREQLTPIERHWSDLIRSWLKGDLAGALRSCRQVAHLNALFQYEQGLEALGVNYPRETIDVYATLNPEGTMMKGWWPYWGNLVRAHHMLGNYKQELIEARRGRKQYPELFSILWYEVRALATLGRIEEVNKRIDESLNLPPQRLWDSETVMMYAASELREHGYKEAAHKLLQRAIESVKSRTSGDHRYLLAQLFYLDEQWQAAKKLFEILAKEQPGNIEYIGYLGTIAARRGEREEAKRINKLLMEMKRPYLFGRHIYWQARIASLLGEKDRSMMLLRDALSKGIAYNIIHPEMDLEPLWDYPPFKELIRPKG
jgi:tetratricopeptide (TPR) repeat protein/TolB-like protein